MNRRLALFSSLALLAIATYILGWSSFFTVSSVEITGTKTQLSSDISTGEKLARIEPRAIAAKFETLDWVAEAKVSRNWINGKVSIEITERTPVAIFNKIVFDSAGNSFVLRGTPSSPLVQIQASDLGAAKKAVTFFSSLPVDLKSALMELKLKVYKALIALPENASIKRVDVSAPHAPIVK